MRTLVEVDEFDADVDVPEDGDARTSASVGNAFQALADRTKYLKARHEEVAEDSDARLTIQEAYALALLSGTALERGDYLTLSSLVAAAGFSLADSDQQLVVPAPTGLYLVNIQALITLDTDLADDTSFLKVHSTTSGDISSSISYGARCDIVPGRTFVHHLNTLVNGNIYIKWGTVANTDRTATITQGVLSVRRVT